MVHMQLGGNVAINASQERNLSDGFLYISEVYD